MANFFRKLTKLFRRSAAVPTTDPGKAMIDMVSATADDEIDCEAAYERLNEYADMFVRGEDVSRILPAVHRHIEMCKDCREEFQALLRAIQAKRS